MISLILDYFRNAPNGSPVIMGLSNYTGITKRKTKTPKERERKKGWCIVTNFFFSLLQVF